VSTHFLAAEPAIPGRFESAGSSRAFVRRRGDDPALVCLHGIPFDSDAWLDVLASLTSDVVAPDLPGLGRSAPSPLPPAAWLSHLAPETPSIIAGHSLGCEYAVRFAAAHPDRVRGLVLVSPFFLQAPPSLTLRAWPLVAATLARATEARLRARLLDGAPGADEALRSAGANLTRRGVARRTARTLAAVASPRHRAQLRSMLATLDIPVSVVHGSSDPLVSDPPDAALITTIEGTGHNPHLTHPADTAAAIRSALERP
jgi:pimeloyl-ACP methyl ester carboxylesterase